MEVKKIINSNLEELKRVLNQKKLDYEKCIETEKKVKTSSRKVGVVLIFVFFLWLLSKELDLSGFTVLTFIVLVIISCLKLFWIYLEASIMGPSKIIELIYNQLNIYFDIARENKVISINLSSKTKCRFKDIPISKKRLVTGSISYESPSGEKNSVDLIFLKETKSEVKEVTLDLEKMIVYFPVE